MFSFVTAIASRTFTGAFAGSAVVLSVMIFSLQGGMLAQSISEQDHRDPTSRFIAGKAPQSLIKANVDLVLVDVTVTDRDGHIVSGLNAGDFSVLDGKSQQRIRYFGEEDSPISIAVLLDSSTSMWHYFDEARSAAIEFFRESNPLDEFALVSFADKPRVVVDFSDLLSELQPVLLPLEPKGYTALWDAIYLGASQMRHAKYPKKAILIISDGGDNHSRYTQAEVKKMLEEADVQVYAIDLFKAYPKTVEEKSGLLWLDEVTTVTGGRTFLVHDAAELHEAVREINSELRNQYVLGFLPESIARDGKWHKLKVDLSPTTQGKLRVYAKKGYYAPAD
ncbi:MAG TPA: VWA domain-containing protein [Candidatus Acidoferrales bacterium]|nr:VWA domain-containing protein [Candidatus Acidoferrales bacterium]